MKIKIAYEMLVANGPDDFDREESEEKVFNSKEEACDFIQSIPEE